MQRIKQQNASSALTLKNKLIYGIGAMGLDMSYGLCFSFFMKYSTDVLLIDSFFLGVMMAVARVWDGVNDPMMGTIANNTKSRFGRFRPWVFLGGILNAVVLFFLFFNPGFNTGSVKLHIYITIFYVLWGMSMTMIDIPYWSFIPTLTSNLNERNVISAIPRFFSGLGQLTVMGATPLILSAFPAEKQSTGFALIAAGLSIMMIITSTITAAGTRERIVPPKEEKFTFKETLRTLRGNDQLLVFLVVVILFNLGWYMMNALAAYFFDYVAEDNKLFTLFAAVSGVAQAVGLVLMSPLSKRFGKQRVFKGGITAAIVGYLALLFISTRGTLNIPLFFAFDLLACLGIGCVFTAEMSMFADLVDYGEFKLGKRTESIVYSMKSFQMKFAQMAQALIMGIGLAIFSYQKNVHPQPESGKTGIVLMMFLIPPILALAALILFTRKYKLHSEYLEDISQAAHKGKLEASSTQ
ncbi:MAG: glycoside-pentoside-hexuronide (GPH):cation symporter [Oscillospiraceae bacterium]|nr:glycoside-pentoside-hexuronide (GPH):cation symporter [Oscillospiraceae bacterium]